MAGKTAILSLKIIGDATSAQKAAATTQKEISGLEKAMGGLKKGAAIAGAAAGAALLMGLNQAIDNDSAIRKLSAANGFDPAEQEAAGKMAGDLYKNAYGESMEQVTATIDGVSSTLADMSANGGADVERLTKKALDLAAVFPEVGDGVASAGILMKTGLAKNADEAYDLMAGSMQKMPAAMRAELIPVMDEYSRHFADLGIDGTTAFGIMTQAAQDGAIGMDKTGDALKELTIRATDGSKTTIDAYKAMGLNSDKMTEQMLAGGDQAQDAFGKIVAGLQGIDDPAEQSAAALALFGTPLEDLGTAKIPEFLGAIDPAGDAFDSLAGKADEMGKTLNDGPGVALETLKRTAMDSFTQIMAAALPVLQPIIGMLQQYAPIIGPVAVAIAGLAAMVWLVNGAMTAWTAVMAISRGAMAVATAMQWAWNAAMAANPIGVVIILIAALVAGVIWAYENVGWFRDALNFLGEVAAGVWQWIVDGINNVITWLDNMLAPVGGIEGALAIMGEAAGLIWEGFIGWLEDAIGWLNDVLEPVGGIDGALVVLGDTAAAIFGGINDAISGTIGWVKDAIGWFQGLFGAKNDANSVAVDGGGAGTASTQSAPMTMAIASEPMMMTAYSEPMMMTTSTAGTGGYAGALTGAIERNRTDTAGGNTYINVEIKADATTDRAGLGRQFLQDINHALAVRGKPKLATV